MNATGTTFGRRAGKVLMWVVISVATFLFVVLPLFMILVLWAWGTE